VAVKILENVADNIEEIEEEFLVLRDLSVHPNIPTFHGLYLRRGQTQEEDQLWFTMEVSQPINQLRSFSPQANYTDRATAACRLS
jgi:putative alpha-1,2-mannosidase